MKCAPSFVLVTLCAFIQVNYPLVLSSSESLSYWKKKEFFQGDSKYEQVILINCISWSGRVILSKHSL